MTGGVPYLDLGAAYRELAPELDAAVLRVLRSGRYILGPEVEAFETAFAAHTGTAQAVGCATGLDALILALRALGIGTGDEVIVPSNTYIATWLAVSAVGATIVPVEPDPDSALIEARAVAAAIGPRTAAVLCVHLYGRACDWRPLRALCDARSIALVEDAAQAHGAQRDGRRAGAFGHVGCFSFYPSKNLGALGDAGAVTTDDAALADRVRVLRNYGSRERYNNEVEGMNSRLDPVQAAVLGVKLEHLDAWNARRLAIAAGYDAALADVPGLVLPPARHGDVHHLYVLRTDDRDGLRAHLTSAGVGSEVHYPIPPHRSEAYARLGHRAGAFPIAERLASEVLSLPIGPQLQRAQATAVTDAVRAWRPAAALAA
ncbi:MAG TPA: DegT/DnrJ/EryC1/StrS family aminotransferase [Baekduia sp.]|jgi:dTDP-4-amino-4,6-dideoxygalactose transaminase|nr:DegT/DnrJ/EryC1/StrS family aminotransferase [Baekduia sp.]